MSIFVHGYVVNYINTDYVVVYCVGFVEVCLLCWCCCFVCCRL